MGPPLASSVGVPVALCLHQRLVWSALLTGVELCPVVALICNYWPLGVSWEEPAEAFPLFNWVAFLW